MLISEHYREQNRVLHAVGNYGVTAPRHMRAILTLAESCQAKTVLDYGSGTKEWCRKFFWEQPNITVHSYDPCVEDLSADPEPADLLVCCDVLEHIEPDCLRDVLQHIHTRTNRAAYLSISLRPAKKTLPDGRNAHLLIKSGEWWVNQLMTYFTIRYYEDREIECVVEGTPR